jgi:hypothetical protein
MFELTCLAYLSVRMKNLLSRRFSSLIINSIPQESDCCCLLGTHQFFSVFFYSSLNSNELKKSRESFTSFSCALVSSDGRE